MFLERSERIELLTLTRSGTILIVGNSHF